METQVRMLILATVIALCPAAALADLLTGETAPSVSVSQWLRGGPVDVLDGQHIYVVEFWETSCGPCREAIPHLTEIQHTYAQDVVIVAISDEPASLIEAFLGTRQDLDYIVAADDQMKTFARYLIRWIPQAFIIHPDGTIYWQGHSMGLDEPLEQIVSNPISITQQPAGKWLEMDEPYTLEVAAVGLGPLHYAWYKDGVPVGDDDPVYAIQAATFHDAGTYTCIVSDERARKSQLTSQPAVLQVFPVGSLPVAGLPGLIVLATAILLLASHRIPSQHQGRS